MLVTLCFAVLSVCACGGNSDDSNAPATPVHNFNSVLVAESESDFQLGGDFEHQLRESMEVWRLWWPRPYAKFLVDYAKKESAAKARKAADAS